MRCSGMALVKLYSQTLTRIGIVSDSRLEEQLLHIARQVSPSIENCAAKQVIRASHQRAFLALM